MLADIRLRSESGTLVKVLHVLDCLLAATLLPALTWAHQVSWDRDYTSLTIFILCTSYILFYSARLYQPWRGVGFYREFLAIVKAWVVILGLVFFALFLTKTSYQFSRRVLLSWAVIGPAAVFVLHVGARYFLRLIRKKGYNIRKAVIVGAGDLGLRFATYLEQMPWSGIRVMGFFDDRKTNRDIPDHDAHILGSIDELPAYLHTNDIDYVYIALPMRAERRIGSILDKIRSHGSLIYIIPDLFAFRMLNSEVQTLGNLVLISLNPSHSYKRYFDIVFSLAVITLGSPLFALIALTIKLEDRGPVFYRHRRLTTAGRTFGCIKFRTMVPDADAKLKELLDSDPVARKEWHQTFKLKNDPRITRVGKWLRVSSLDELPQFVNVLKGEMSVVGARPIVAQELQDYYNGCEGLYCSIKPGITGPWQVGGRSDTEDYDQRVRMDSEYILHRNMWLDLKIIFQTVWKVLKREGAY